MNTDEDEMIRVYLCSSVVPATYAIFRTFSSSRNSCGMGSVDGVGFAAEGVEHLFELLVRAEVEIEEEELSALQLAAASAAAGKPLLANRIAQPRGQIERLLQHLYRVHPSFSKSPTSVSRARRL